MEFWGVEVKSGEPFDVIIDEGKALHLTQAVLGDLKTEREDSVCLYMTLDSKKFVLGTLNSEVPLQLYNLVFHKDFQFSHNSKNGGVYFYGYTADQPPAAAGIQKVKIVEHAKDVDEKNSEDN